MAGDIPIKEFTGIRQNAETVLHIKDPVARLMAIEIGKLPSVVYAVCEDMAASPTSAKNTWYVNKSSPRPPANVGLIVDVLWTNGLEDGLGYNASLVWGAPGESDNEIIVESTPVHDSLSGTVSIPTESTIRYQLTEKNGHKSWQYVGGKVIRKSFSSATAADVPNKVIPGMSLAYVPGMEVYLQLDKGNTANTMRLVPDEGETLPVYGNGTGKTTGGVPAGYILHLVNAGDHWQVVNGGGSSSDVSKQYVDEQVATRQPKQLVVTGAYPDKSSHSSQEVYDAYLNDINITFVYQATSYTLVRCDASVAIFENVDISTKFAQKSTITLQGSSFAKNRYPFYPSAVATTATVPSGITAAGNVQSVLDALGAELSGVSALVGGGIV